MRLFTIVFLCLGVMMPSFVLGNDTLYVIPIDEAVSVYHHVSPSIALPPVFTVSTTTKLQVIGQTKIFFRVRDCDDNNRTGWVDKGSVAVANRSARLAFTDMPVIGYEDNPDLIIINDADFRYGITLKLDRSFKESLGINTDRETISRNIDAASE